MKPRKTNMAEVDLLDFLRDCKRFAIQALGTNAGKPAEGGLARWKHLVIHGYRVEDDHSYRETENRLRCFSELREILELDLNDVPDYSTIYKSFDRFNMAIWRELLRVSAEQLPQSGHAALDSTFFERGHASSYYLQRSDRNVQTLKVTTLTDTESLAVLDLQCSVHWKDDTKIGLQVVRRNADDLLSVAADKAFHSWVNTFELYTLDVDPLVLNRGSSPEAVGHNALIRDAGYSRRWMAETSYSTTKRSLGPAVRARFWYREFREIVLKFAISNIEQLCEPL
jgi:IS5 family transposase